MADVPGAAQVLGALTRVRLLAPADRRRDVLLGLVGLLLVGDVVVLAAHVAADLAGLDAGDGTARLLSLDREGSWGEGYGYLKYLWAGVTLLLLPRARARWVSPVPTTWGVLLLLLMADDALRLHERAGRFVAGAADLPAVGAMTPAQLGELAVVAAVGGPVVVVLAVAHLLAAPADRGLSLRLAALLGLLVLAGVVVDAVHSVLGRADLLLVLLEDGGELVVAGLMLVLAVSRSDRRHDAAPRAVDLTSRTAAVRSG